jgi:3-phenylpropionate/cinnamic acid dioxygenase small subunit
MTDVIAAGAPATRHCAVGSSEWCMAVEFLDHEAELLDEDRLDEWLPLLDQDLLYRMPVRVTARRGQGLGYSSGLHFDEDLASIQLRVRRLTETSTAWAEDPPSRARRHVSNVRVAAADDGRLVVRSYLLLYRSRWDLSECELLSAERVDTLVPADDGLRLRSREIRVDQATLGVLNLALFL